MVLAPLSVMATGASIWVDWRAITNPDYYTGSLPVIVSVIALSTISMAIAVTVIVAIIPHGAIVHR